MRCKVLVVHHSYLLKRRLYPGEVVDIPEAVLVANKTLYEESKEEVTPTTSTLHKPEREKIEKDLIRRKLARPEEVDRLSIDQLLKLQADNPPPTKETLIEEAFSRKLGTRKSLEGLDEIQLTTLLNGAK